MLSKHCRNRIFVAALLLAGAGSPTLAADLPLEFGGLKIGDSVQTVRSNAAKGFPYILPPEASSPQWMEVGDEAGRYTRTCTEDVQHPLPKNCLNVQLHFKYADGADRLILIIASQTFEPAIPFAAISKALEAKYGSPRLRYEGDDIRHDDYGRKTDDVALVWGGRSTPLSPYRPRAAAWKPDFDGIGGRYVVALLHRKDGRLTGYELQILDSDRIARSGATVDERLQESRRANEQRNVDSLKF